MSLQPERIIERNPDAEDDAYDAARQRELDDEIERDSMREEAQASAIKGAMLLLGVSGAKAEASLRILYQLGYMDGVLRASRVGVA